MSKTVIEVNNLAKQYRLGMVGTSTMSDDLKRFFYKIRGKEDPFLKVGETNDRTQKANSDYVWALKDINFKVQQGEVLGIIGKNGAGKSTLLKILSRTTLPTIGEYKIRGRIASLLEVGTGFHPDLSGRENIYLNGAILGMTKAEIKKQFDAIVDFSGVERYIDTPVKRYSSGMYVRLAFAVAAHLEPEILIIDEVLAVGDAEFQKKCLGKMKDVSEQGRTVLFVSHNMIAVQNLCTNGILLVNGKISEVGDIESVSRTYLSMDTVNTIDPIKSLIKSKRTRGKGAFIKEAWIEDSSGELQNSVLAGEPFSIKFKFESEIEISNGLFGFGIEDNEGLRISSLNNEIAGSGVYHVLKDGTACCTFYAPNLIDGTYWVSLSIVSNQVEWIDYVERAFTFNVESNDVYGTGKLISKAQGKIFLHGKVEII